MKQSSGRLVLLMASLLLLGLSANLWAEACYVLQGIVKRSDNQQPVNGVAIYVNGEYQGTTLHVSGSLCGEGVDSDGVYRIEADAPGINKCSNQNNVGGEINIGGTWYRGGGKCIWAACGWTGECKPGETPPCGRYDFYVVPNGSMPPSNWYCPQSTDSGGKW
jgi:hypothetical protein